MSFEWPLATLGEEIELLYGRSLPEAHRRPGGVPVFGSNGPVGGHDEALVPGPGIVVGRKGSLGAVAYSETPFWPIDTTYYVRNIGGHDWRFLYFLLKHLGLDQLNSHAVVPGLNRETVYSIEVRLPRRQEQTVIASLLSGVQKAIVVEERLVRSLRELKQAAMRQLFTRGLHVGPQKETDIGAVPDNWEIVPLGALGRIGNGSTPKRTNPAYWTGGTLPWLTSGKIHEAVISAADEFVTPLAAEECHLPKVPAGSLLIAITGQGKTLGNVAITTLDTFVSQHLAYVTIEREDVDANFMRHYLSGRYDYLRGLGQAGGSTKGALTCAGLKMVAVPLPPLDEQREIASMLDLIDRKADVHDRKRAVAQELFDVLLDELITGRLRVDDLDVTALEHAAAATPGEAMRVRVRDLRDDSNDDMANRTPEERLAMMWQLTRDAWAFTDHPERAESRLQRHVVRTRRRER